MAESKVRAGSNETNFVSIGRPEIVVRHDHSGHSSAGPTYLFAPGSHSIRYQLEEGSHTVEPGHYDHGVAYSGVPGPTLYGTLEYSEG